MSGASDLHKARHFSPAAIDLDTLELTAAGLDGKTTGQVETFLREAGLPLEYLESFQRRIRSAQFYSCFIAHSSEDRTFCQRLFDRMRAEGIRVWFSPENIQGGDKIYDQIKKAIHSHDKLLLVLSEHSMRSSWVELEIREALERERDKGGRVLFPISVTHFDAIKKWKLIDVDSGQDLAARIREYFVPDFSQWKEGNAFEASVGRLLSDLKASEARQRIESNDEAHILRIWK